METIETVLAEAQKNGRICPQPKQWQELYEMLPNKKRKGQSWEPALPLILAAWCDASEISKVARLREHIEWAETQGCLENIASFLQGLSEKQWHHLGD